LVKQHNADIGFAFDGDGDRLIVVNKHGNIKNGDDLLFLLLSLPEFKEITTVVGTVMSNQGFEDALKKNNKQLIRTKVGDKYVAQEMKKQHLPLGGEISGHIIIKNYLSTSDGIFVALKILLAIVQTKNWKLETFTPYPQHLINVAINNKKDLTLPPLANIIKKYESTLIDGHILVRYSGTENILRVMVEASKQETVINTANELAKELKQVIDNSNTQ
jgi:phosphoglucosamine mutase